MIMLWYNQECMQEKLKHALLLSFTYVKSGQVIATFHQETPTHMHTPPHPLVVTQQFHSITSSEVDRNLEVGGSTIEQHIFHLHNPWMLHFG